MKTKLKRERKEVEPCAACGSKDIGFVLDSTRRMKCSCCGNYGEGEDSNKSKANSFYRALKRWNNEQIAIRDNIYQRFENIEIICSKCQKYQKYDIGETHFNNCARYLANGDCPNKENIDQYEKDIGIHFAILTSNKCV